MHHSSAYADLFTSSRNRVHTNEYKLFDVLAFEEVAQEEGLSLATQKRLLNLVMASALSFAPILIRVVS